MVNSPQSTCISCFTQHATFTNPCPVCGYNELAQFIPPHILPPRTILNGKYLIGKMLGQGGFGITYIGRDLNLEMKVAVKEYYPTGFVTREVTGYGSATVQPFSGPQGEYFLKGREKFIHEGRLLAKFFSLPGIVTIKDYFQENSTAYISMEFIDGYTLKDHLVAMGGKLPAAQVFDMMMPVMSSLAEIHKTGLIHRDISPDNIMINKEGQMKLLDFGAARDYTDTTNKSMSIMLKPGFAPEEQYRSKGNQGPWTDVYALSATIYRCITGITPEESIERVQTDSVKSPSALGLSLDPVREAALMTGMAVFQSNRYQSIPELYNAFYAAAAPVAAPVTMPATQYVSPEPLSVAAPVAPKPAHNSKLIGILLSITAICFLAVGVFFLTQEKSGENGNIQDTPSISQPSDKEQPVAGSTETPDLVVGSDSYIRTTTLGPFQIETDKPESQRGWFTDGLDEKRSPFTARDFTSSRFLVLKFDRKPYIELEFVWIGDSNDWEWTITSITPHDDTVILDMTRVTGYDKLKQSSHIKLFICTYYDSWNDLTLIDAYFADKT